MRAGSSREGEGCGNRGRMESCYEVRGHTRRSEVTCVLGTPRAHPFYTSPFDSQLRGVQDKFPLIMLYSKA